MVQIIVFDDELLYCFGMKIAFKQFPDIHVAGDAYCEEGIFELLARTPADVVVLGVNLPDHTGCVDIALRLRRDYPAIKIIAVVDEDNAGAIQSLLGTGIDGCIGKREANGPLLAAMIRKVVTEDENSDNNINR